MPTVDLQTHRAWILSSCPMIPPDPASDEQDVVGAQRLLHLVKLVDDGVHIGRVVPHSCGNRRRSHWAIRVQGSVCNAKFSMALGNWPRVFKMCKALLIKLLRCDCKHHQPSVRTSKHWQLVTINGYGTILQIFNQTKMGLSMQRQQKWRLPGAQLVGFKYPMYGCTLAVLEMQAKRQSSGSLG